MATKKSKSKKSTPRTKVASKQPKKRVSSKSISILPKNYKAAVRSIKKASKEVASSSRRIASTTSNIAASLRGFFGAINDRTKSAQSPTKVVKKGAKKSASKRSTKSVVRKSTVKKLPSKKPPVKQVKSKPPAIKKSIKKKRLTLKEIDFLFHASNFATFNEWRDAIYERAEEINKLVLDRGQRTSRRFVSTYMHGQVYGTYEQIDLLVETIAGGSMLSGGKYNASIQFGDDEGENGEELKNSVVVSVTDDTKGYIRGIDKTRKEREQRKDRIAKAARKITGGSRLKETGKKKSVFDLLEMQQQLLAEDKAKANKQIAKLKAQLVAAKSKGKKNATKRSARTKPASKSGSSKRAASKSTKGKPVVSKATSRGKSKKV